MKKIFLIIISFALISCSSTNKQYEQAQLSYSQQNYSRAFEQLWKPAQNKDPRALYAMGYMYYYGIGTNKNQNLGRELMEEAAKKNYQPAITALKLIYEKRFQQYGPLQKYS